MGGSSSSLPGGDMSHQQLFDMTKDTRLIMNKLLDYGLHKIAVSEFVKLSSPEGCKNYVMFLTNSIHKLFYELQVAPGTDKRGVIFFRSIKDLTEPTEQEKVERQSLCLTLAYFYTRIFQIYGSIALTLIDDINDISQLGIFEGMEQSRSFGAPGVYPSTMQGGAFTLTTMGNFQFLKSYLTDQTYGNEGFRTRYVGSSSTTTANIYFTAEIDGQNASATQQGKFAIAYTGAKEFSYLPITATGSGIGSNNLIISFGKIKYQKKGDSTDEKRHYLIPSKSLQRLLEKCLRPAIPIRYLAPRLAWRIILIRSLPLLFPMYDPLLKERLLLEYPINQNKAFNLNCV